jgi:thiol-disulfide isomerase/thioredoxin
VQDKISVIIITVLMSAGSFIYAEEQKEAPPKKLRDVYPSLTSGMLAYAELRTLPGDTLFQAEGVEIKAESVTKIINSQPESAKEEFKKNAFFILEQEATNRLLVRTAKEALARSETKVPLEVNKIVQQFFEQEVFKNVEVADKEVKEFYEKNKDMFGGALLSQVAASLEAYLVSQKKQQVASEYVRTLGQHVDIQVSESWIRKQAALALDNPVDRARGSGRPSLVDFGADGCKPCDMMAPILEILRAKYEGRVNVVFVHVREEQILASRYGIQSIPVQVFYDKKGKEVFRHTGFFPQEEIEKKLKEVGVH